MKRKIMVFLMVLMVMFMIASCVDVNPGEVGVRVWKRGDKAGEIEVLDVGRHDKSIRATDNIFPTTLQNYVWTASRDEGSQNDESFTFPIEGLVINVDVGIEYSVIKESVDKIYSDYHMGLNALTDGPIRNTVRDEIMTAAQGYSDMESFITHTEIASLIKTVETNCKEYYLEKGINVTKVYLVGSPVYPDTVIASIEAKIKATQQAIQRENELREAEATAQKTIAEADGAAQAAFKKAEGEAKSELVKAEATAKANKLLEVSITPSILQKLWIEKWNGVLPEVMPGDSELMFDM